MDEVDRLRSAIRKGYIFQVGDQLERKLQDGSWILLYPITNENGRDSALKNCFDFPGAYRIVRPTLVFEIQNVTGTKDH